MSLERKTLEQLNLLDRFLFTEAVDQPEVVSEELVELLRYIEESTDETASKCNSPRVKKIHEHVQQLRSDEEVKVRYMQAWEERALDIRDAEERGEARITKLYQILFSEGRVDDLKHALEDSTYQEKLLKEMDIEYKFYE